MPNYSVCVGRIGAYNQIAVYKDAMRAMHLPGAPRRLRVPFRAFWAYKMGVEAQGGSILDDNHLPDTARDLRSFLYGWGMGATRKPIANVRDIQQYLLNVRPNYDAVRNIVLGMGQIQRHRADLEALYAGLDGITNVGDARGASITGRSKALLAIWGQTPGFDKYTRLSFVTWTHPTHPPTPLNLPHLERYKKWYSPGQFYEVIAKLDEWVGMWLTDNYTVFGRGFDALDKSLPVGRIVDEIYNWEFEWEPLLWYLRLLGGCGERQAALTFEELPGVLGFVPAPADLLDEEWWNVKVGNPLDRVRTKQNSDGYPCWRIFRLYIPQHSVCFVCD